MPIYYKSSVLFSQIAAGGFRILGVLDKLSNDLAIDLVITSACDGQHSGPNDPHHRGEAYDVRSHDFTPVLKDKIVAMLTDRLGPLFYAFLEDPNGDNEHIHIQVARGKVFPDPTSRNDSGAGGSDRA